MSLHFIRPWNFLLLMPFLYFLIVGIKPFFEKWQSICDPHLVSHIVDQQARQKRPWTLWLFCLACMLLVFALAGPSWTKKTISSYQRTGATIIALDLSDSMLASDLPPNRLTQAKYQLLDLLAALKEQQVGLIAFAKEAYLVAPLTQDNKTIAEIVPILKPALMPNSGSDIYSALQKAKQMLQNAQYKNGHIILISDSEADRQTLNLSKQMHQAGYDISVLAVGTQKPVPISTENGFLKDNHGNIITSQLNPKSLKKLAQNGGGKFILFNPLNRSIKPLLPSATEKTSATVKKIQQQWVDEGPWFIIFDLIFFLCLLRPGLLEQFYEFK